MIYYATILLTMVILPIASIAYEMPSITSFGTFLLVGLKWFAFWAVGVRLVLAGVTQVVRPRFTVKGILGFDEPRAYVLAQELGFANIALGLAGLLSMLFASWSLPVAFAGGVFLGLAGINHWFRPGRTMRENVAMISDLWAALILLLAFVFSLF